MNNKWLSVIFITLFLPCIMAQTIPNLQVIASETIEADYFEETIELSSFGAVVSSYLLKDISYLQFGDQKIFEKTIENKVVDFSTFLVPANKVVDFENLQSNGVFESSLPISLRETSEHIFVTESMNYFVDGADSQMPKEMDIYFLIGEALVRVFDSEGTLVCQVDETGILRGFLDIQTCDSLLCPGVTEFFDEYEISHDEIVTTIFTDKEPLLEQKRIYVAKNSGVFVSWVVDTNADNLIELPVNIPVLQSVSHESNSLLFAPENVYDLWISY